MSLGRNYGIVRILGETETRRWTSVLWEQFHMNNVHMRTQSFPDVNPRSTSAHSLSSRSSVHMVPAKHNTKIEGWQIRARPHLEHSPHPGSPHHCRSDWSWSCASCWLSDTWDHPLKETVLKNGELNETARKMFMCMSAITKTTVAAPWNNDSIRWQYHCTFDKYHRDGPDLNSSLHTHNYCYNR